MNYKEFCAAITDNIISFLPEEFGGAEVNIMPIVKAGETYDGLTIHSGSRISPTFSMNLLYQQFCTSNISVHTLCEKVSEGIRNMPDDLKDEFLSIEDYASIKGNLSVRLINKERNKDFLKNVPHKEIADLALCYVIFMQHDNGDRIYSATVTKPLLECWAPDISLEKLNRDAIANSQRVFPFKHFSMYFGFGPEMDFLTNETKINGASVIAYPGVLDEIYERYDSAFYMLPSSVHECILIPKSKGTMSPDDLKSIVQDVNRFVVTKTDFLSDNVYYYDRKGFRIA